MVKQPLAVCPYCRARFPPVGRNDTTDAALARHVARKHPPTAPQHPPRPRKCGRCGAEFAGRDLLRIHVQFTHPGAYYHLYPYANEPSKDDLLQRTEGDET